MEKVGLIHWMVKKGSCLNLWIYLSLFIWAIGKICQTFFCGFATGEKNERTRKRRGKEKDRTLTEEERKRTGNLEKRKGIGKEERQGRVNREKQKEDERKKRGKGKRTERGKKKDRQYLTHTHISKPESFICKNIQKHKNGIWYQLKQQKTGHITELGNMFFPTG